MKNFKVKLILQTKDQVMRDLGIDLIHSATDVIRKTTTFLSTGGYAQYEAAAYDIVGTHFGEAYTIRLYARLADSFFLEGPVIDRTTQPGLRAIYAYNWDIDEHDIYEYTIFERFPTTIGQPLGLLEFCKEEAIANRLYDIMGNPLCNGVGIKPVIQLVGGDIITMPQATNFIEPGYVATDAEDGILTPDVQVHGIVNNMWIGLQTLIYAVTDSDYNSVAITRGVRVTPVQQDPIITLNPYSDGSVNPVNITEHDGWTDPWYMAADFEDGNITNDVIVGGDVVNTAVIGAYTILYEVTDSAGNHVATTRTVNVLPNHVPLIQLLSNDDGDISPITLDYGSMWTDPGATASDVEEGDVTNEILTGGDAVDTAIAGTYNLTYTVNDHNQGQTTVSRIVVVNNNTTPGLTLNEMPNGDIIHARVVQNTDWDDPGATAIDHEDGDISGHVTVSGDTVNTAVVGLYVINYTISDQHGATMVLSRTVEVLAATTLPMLTLGDVGGVITPINLPYSNAYVDPANYAEDMMGLNISGGISVTGLNDVDPLTAGTYPIAYSVSDSYGNVQTVTRVVVVAANTAPVITITGNNPQNFVEHDAYMDAGATATDAEQGDITGLISIGGDTVDMTTVGSYNVVYTVTDNGGQSVSETRIVNVTANTAPVVALVGASSEIIGVGATWLDQGATATDAEDGDITGDITVSGSVNSAVAGNYNIGYSVTDGNNGTSVLTRVVTVKPLPIISVAGNNPIGLASGATFSIPTATALDASGNDISASVTEDSAIVINNTIVGDYNVTYTVTDADGVVGETILVVSVSDAPVITMNGTSPVTHTENGVYTDAGATAIDSEDGDLTAGITVSGTVDVATVGSYTITYNVTDSAGVMGTLDRVVNIVANTLPVMTMVGNNPDNIGEGVTYMDAGATAMDAEQGDITGDIVVGGDTVNTAAVGAYNVTYTVTDANGGVANQTRVVNVIALPVLTIAGSNPVGLEVGTVFAPAAVTAVDDGGNDITPTVMDDSAVSLDSATIGQYTITYTATDSVGIVGMIELVVNVSTAPVVTVTGDNPLVVATDGTYTDPGATSIDTEDGDVSGSIVVGGDVVDPATPGTYGVTYTSTDTAGVESVGTRDVVVEDAPVITMTGDNPMSIATGGVFTDPGVTVMDTEDGDISAGVVVSGDTVDTAITGSYNVIYTSTDSHGVITTETRVVIVNDAPVLGLLGDNPLIIASGSIFTDPGANAMDAEDGDITANIVVSGDVVNTALNANYNVTYTITDANGLQDTDTRVVTVEDAPVITLTGGSPVSVAVGGTWTDPGSSATDTEDGNLTGSIVIGGDTVDPATAGAYDVTYTVTDSQGLTTLETRTVNVQNAPTITLNGITPMGVELGGTYTDPGATANDSEDGDVSGSIVVGGDVVDPMTAGLYNVTYTITDSGGLVTVETRVVDVNEAPSVMVTGDDPMNIVNGDTFTDPGATSTDTEDGNLTASIVVGGDTVDTNTNGTYVITYTVTDSTGLTGSKTRDVVVANNVIPVITLNGTDMNVLRNGTFTDPLATANDAEDGDISGSIVIGGDTVDPATLGAYVITYNVTDSHSGNAVEVTRTVTVITGDSPTVTILGANPQPVAENGTYTDPGATAADTEDGNLTANIVVGGDVVDPALVGAYNVTYTVTDTQGNTTVETRVVNVSTNVIPVITVSGDNPYYVAQNTTYSDPGATANDAEDGDITVDITDDSGSVDMATIGGNLVTFNVADSAGGNAVAKTRTVNVVHPTDPAIDLLAHATGPVSPVNLVVGDAWVEPGTFAYDFQEGDVSALVNIGGDTVNTAVAGTYNVTYDYTDNDTNMATQMVRQVVVGVNTIPLITIIGNFTETVLENGTWIDPGTTAADTEDGDITGSVVVGGDTVDTSTLGDYNVTYDVTDSHGGMAVQVVRIVKVMAAGPPTLVLEADYRGDIDPVEHVNGDLWVEPGYESLDAEDGNTTILVVVTGDFIDHMTVNGSYTKTYTVTDSDSNTVTINRTVNVVNNQKPVVTLLGANNILHTRGEPYVDTGSTATDHEDGDVTAGIAEYYNNLDINTLGSYSIGYHVVDSHGLSSIIKTRYITVVHETDPTLTLTSYRSWMTREDVYVGHNLTWTDPGATATDQQDGDITANIVVSGDTVNTAQLGTYEIIYTITDTDGNVVTKTRNVHVIVDVGPVVTPSGQIEPYIYRLGSYTEMGAFAFDALEGNTPTTQSGTVPDTNVVGVYVQTHSATDDEGNTGTKDRIVHIVSEINPHIRLTSDSHGNKTPIDWVVGTPWVDPGSAAYDAQDGSVTPSIVITGDTVDVNVIGAYNVVYTATDSDTNTGTETRVVNVVANTIPTLTLNLFGGANTPINLTVGDTYIEKGASADDNEDGDISPSVVVAGDVVDTAVVGVYVVTYDVTDTNGGVATQITRTVNVV